MHQPPSSLSRQRRHGPARLQRQSDFAYTKHHSQGNCSSLNTHYILLSHGGECIANPPHWFSIEWNSAFFSLLLSVLMSCCVALPQHGAHSTSTTKAHNSYSLWNLFSIDEKTTGLQQFLQEFKKLWQRNYGLNFYAPFSQVVCRPRFWQTVTEVENKRSSVGDCLLSTRTWLDLEAMK